MQYYYQPGGSYPVYQNGIQNPEAYKKFMYRNSLKKDSNKIGLLLIIIEIISIIVSLIIGFLEYDNLKNSTYVFLYEGLLSLLFFFIPSTVFILVNRLSFNDILPFKNTKKGLTPILVMFGFALCMAANLVSMLMSGFMQMIGLNPSIDSSFETNSTLDIVLYFVIVAIIPALIEEYAFRGVIYGVLEKYSKGLAIFVSSVLFAIFHGNFEQIFFVLPVAFIFGYARAVSNSMLPSIIIHCLNNATSVALTLMYENEMIDIKYAYLIEASLMILIAIFGVIGAVLLIKRGKTDKSLFTFEDSNTVIPFREKMKIACARPTIIIVSAFMLLQSLLLLVLT